jgi:hypothetical protein
MIKRDKKQLTTHSTNKLIYKTQQHIMQFFTLKQTLHRLLQNHILFPTLVILLLKSFRCQYYSVPDLGQMKPCAS